MSDTPVEQGGERDTKPLNIYQRRNMAKKAVYEHEFSKTDGAGLKYKYLPVEKVKPVVEKAWNDAGIVMDLVETEFREMRPNWEQRSEYGTSRWFHIEARLRIALVNIDDPSDRVGFEIYGEGKDNSDKAESKAYTAAIKNFYKLEFNIAEGPKDDADALQTDQAIEESNMSPKDLEAAKAAKLEQAKADPFFGKESTEQRQAEAVGKALGADAEFLDGEAISEVVKARRDSVNVGNARATLAQLKARDPENEILAGYISKHGPLGKFADAAVIDCYLDLVDAGVIQ